MKNRTLAVTCLALSACAGPRAVMGPVEVVEDFQAALVAGDIERAAAHLDPAVVILESGGAERSRDEYLAGHAKADSEFLKSARITAGPRTARVEGGVAWVASESEVRWQHEAETRSVASAETMVLRADRSGWKIVHIHWSSHPLEAR